MLAYAPRPDPKQLRPATLGLIVLGHIGLLALVVTAKSGIETTPFDPPDIVFVPEPPVPPPTDQPPPKPKQQSPQSKIDTFDPVLRPIPSTGPTVDQPPGPTIPTGPTIGTGTEPIATPIPLDPPIVRKAPRFITEGNAVRPPYPVAKREAGDEASLRLKLTIDVRGRVIAVEPVGRADPTFLEAARRHILRVWRYQPAMEGSKAVPSTATVTLKFELGSA